MIFVLGGTLGLSLLIFGLRLGALAVIFVYFCGSGAGPWTPFSTFLEKARKRSKKGKEKGAEMDAFSFEFQGFP